MATTTTKTGSLTVYPSGYDSSKSAYSGISSSYPITNAYASSTSTTYAYITALSGTNSTSYISLTFDLSSIPSDATISSVSCTAKAAVSTTSSNYISSAVMQLYNGTTAKGSTTSFLNSATSATAQSLTCGTWTRSELDNLELRFTEKNSSRGQYGQNARYIYIYGADLTIAYTYNEIAYEVTITSSGPGTTTPTGTQTVASGGSITISCIKTYASSEISLSDNGVGGILSSDGYSISNVIEDHTIAIEYSEPNKYNVETTIKHGTVISPTTNPTEVVEGESLTINFSGDTEATFQSMTVNGVSVTPTEVESDPGQDSTTATYTYETNYSIYSTYALANAFDGSTSTKFWSNGAQTAGKYVLITFNKYINLTSFSTYSENSTDYPQSCNVLQVSADGSDWTTIGTFTDAQTSTFSSLSTGNIKYVRIYANSTISNWLVINTVTMVYTTPEIPATTAGYAYTIDNIQENQTVVITYKLPEGVFMKVAANTWMQADKVFKKTSTGWEEIEATEFYSILKNNKVIKK